MCLLRKLNHSSPPPRAFAVPPSAPSLSAPPLLPMSPFHTSFRHSERRRKDKHILGFCCLRVACRRPSSTLFRSLQDVILAQEVLQPLVLMTEVPVLHNLLELLQHRLTLSTHTHTCLKTGGHFCLVRLTKPHLFFHVGHLGRRFVPQLVRQAQLHLHAFVHQVPQGGHRLAGPLREEQTLAPLLRAGPKRPCHTLSPWRIGGCPAARRGRCTAGHAGRCCPRLRPVGFPCGWTVGGVLHDVKGKNAKSNQSH